MNLLAAAQPATKKNASHSPKRRHPFVASSSSRQASSASSSQASATGESDAAISRCPNTRGWQATKTNAAAAANAGQRCRKSAYAPTRQPAIQTKCPKR